MTTMRARALLPVLAALAVGACALDPNETLIEALETPQAATASTASAHPLPAPDQAAATSPLIHGTQNGTGAAQEGLLSYEEQTATRSSLEALAKSRASGQPSASTSSVDVLRKLGATHGDAAIADIEGAPAAAQ
ncbi:hypothetical protein H2509_19505 [Stappia sp. F7233]|uniref:DUF3035 domain-containing protein n=1 Tax=Stappia albiluteola TaxID=2758565 RepID=A0A839AKB0_9HYPH|nr:hypothetical protein [Stappia albiluteola]MBA5779322.1 hypothetical protein [Stappia albiluteola]